MIVAQILLPNATAYERKCQRVDFAALSADHQVTVPVPYVESRQADLPEAVEERYFADARAGEGAGAPPKIGSFWRRGIMSLVQQTSSFRPAMPTS